MAQSQLRFQDANLYHNTVTELSWNYILLNRLFQKQIFSN